MTCHFLNRALSSSPHQSRKFYSNMKVLIFLAAAIVACYATSDPSRYEKQVVLMVCGEGKAAMNQLCDSQCNRLGLALGSDECLQSCEFTKSYFFGKCDNMNWATFQKDVMSAFCPYLIENNYNGYFMRYCRNQKTKIEFCNNLKSALDQVCGDRCHQATDIYLERCETMSWTEMTKTVLKRSCEYLRNNNYNGHFMRHCTATNY